MSKPIQFHWRLIHGGEFAGISRSRQLETDSMALPDINQQVAFCKAAENAGIESLLADISYGKPDPLLLAAGILPYTSKIKFLIAVRSSLISPTYWVQQVNTISSFTQGRVLFNIVAGHSPEEQRFYGDALPHDERYERTEEFLNVAMAYWNKNGPVNFEGKYYKIESGELRTPFISMEGRSHPYLFIAGNSECARNLAISQGSCWMRLPDTPAKIAELARPVLAAGKEVGLRLSIIARPTRKEAMEAAIEQTKVDESFGATEREKLFVGNTDSVMMKEMYQKAKQEEWITPFLWTGAVKVIGAPSVALLGTPDEICNAIMEYKAAGVTQYILSGWPKLDEMVYFGKEIIPRVRAREVLEREEIREM